MVTLNTISEFCRNTEEFEKSFKENPKSSIKKIQKHIISYWNKNIAAYHKAHPLTDAEKSLFTAEELKAIKTEAIYGTTLIAAYMGRNFSFGIQLGDGSLVVVNDRAEAEMPIEDDESCPANLTASICNSNAIDMFNSFYTFEKPLAIFVSTDGLYTSFGSREDFLDYHVILTGLLDDKMDEFEQLTTKNLTKRTHYGTQDDISLAGVFTEGVIKANQGMIMEQIKRNRNLAEIRRAEHEAKIRKRKAKLAAMRRKEESDT
jgi:hypothetical protein